MGRQQGPLLAPPGAPSEATWLARAACRGEDLTVFFPETPTGRLRYDAEAMAEAVQVCARCPVRAACLSDAVALGDYDGIRAGLTGRERKRTRRYDCRTCGIPSPQVVCRVCRSEAAETHHPTEETDTETEGVMPVYDEIEFVEELPAEEGRRHDHIVQALASRPGQWGVVATYGHRGSAHSLASDIRTGRRRRAYRPAGSYDAEVRRSDRDPTQWVVYARSGAQEVSSHAS